MSGRKTVRDFRAETRKARPVFTRRVGIPRPRSPASLLIPLILLPLFGDAKYDLRQFRIYLSSVTFALDNCSHDLMLLVYLYLIAVFRDETRFHGHIFVFM